MKGRQVKDGTVTLQDVPPRAGKICGYGSHCGLCEVKTQVEDDSLRDKACREKREHFLTSEYTKGAGGDSSDGKVLAL